MKLNTIHVTLKGLPPGLLMNRFSVERYKEQRKQKLKYRKYDPAEEARKSAYIAEIDGRRQLYIPSFTVHSMIIKTAKRYKSEKGVSIHKRLADAIKIDPEKIPLGTDQYNVHVNHTSIMPRGSIRRARAVVPEWRASFNIIYMSEIIPDPYIIRDILEEGSYCVGLLEHRPQHSGPFGTFIVEQFNVEDEEGGITSQSTAWPGMAMQGDAGRGAVRHGEARQGEVISVE